MATTSIEEFCRVMTITEEQFYESLNIFITPNTCYSKQDIEY